MNTRVYEYKDMQKIKRLPGGARKQAGLDDTVLSMNKNVRWEVFSDC